MSSILEIEAEKCLKKLKEKGIKYPCDWIPNLSTKPKWYNNALFKRGEKLCQENLFGMFFSHLCGLYVLVHVPSILYPLLSTGKSKNVSCIFLRYRDTLIHVSKWYSGDIWETDSEAQKSLNVVRKMHLMVSDRLNKNKIEGQDNFYLSQYDMCLTLFAFCGLVTLFPSSFGFFPTSDYDLKCVLHFWRCVGYLLGVKDEYNICNEQKLDEVKAYFNLILEKEMKHALIHEIRPESALMGDAIIESIRTFIPVLKTNGFKRYLFDILSVQSDDLDESMNWLNNFNYHLMNFHFKYGLSFPLVPSIFNKLLKMAINRTTIREEKICIFLSKKAVTFERLSAAEFEQASS